MGSVRDKMVEQIRAAKRAAVVVQEAPVVEEVIVEAVVEEVRARDENGHFIADDPNTPENEAWVSKEAVKEKTKKKTTAKKVVKKVNKKSKQVQQNSQTPEIPRYFVIFWYFYL